MIVQINGKESVVPDSYSLPELIQSRGFKENRVIIELNGQILNREKWHSTRLSPNDSLEIINIIGGG